MEDLRNDVLNKRCRVNKSEVDTMALALSNVSRNLGDLKGWFALSVFLHCNCWSTRELTGMESNNRGSVIVVLCGLGSSPVTSYTLRLSTCLLIYSQISFVTRLHEERDGGGGGGRGPGRKVGHFFPRFGFRSM